METNIWIISTRKITLYHNDIENMRMNAKQMVMYGSNTIDEEIRAIILQVYTSAAKLNIEPMVLVDTAREAIRIEENNVYPLPFKFQ